MIAVALFLNPLLSLALPPPASGPGPNSNSNATNPTGGLLEPLGQSLQPPGIQSRYTLEYFERTMTHDAWDYRTMTDFLHKVRAKIGFDRYSAPFHHIGYTDGKINFEMKMINLDVPFRNADARHVLQLLELHWISERRGLAKWKPFTFLIYERVNAWSGERRRIGIGMWNAVHPG